jgi:dTDP-4-amino-4,6-dideoxygalactose transaminase
VALAPCYNHKIMFKKTIIAEFFTTVSFSQAIDSLYLMTFWSYKLRYWKDRELFEKEFLEFLGYPQGATLQKKSKIISFYNWRNAIYHALKIIWIEKKDEIIISSYNCSVVVNAVIQTYWKIVYSDIEKEALWLDFYSLKKNITENTKVIIIQHTFWKQAKYYEEIIKLAKEKNILIIEDCAHSLWTHPQPLPCKEGGIIWDFQIFSTWRDKVISSVTWWFLVINNKEYFKTPLLAREGLGVGLIMPSIKLIFQNLMYNIAWYKAYKLYDFLKLGRIIIFLSRKLWLITEILSKKEKNFEYKNFDLWLPNSLACLWIKELKNLDEYTKIRLENIKYYLENIIPLLTSPQGRGIKGFLDLDNYNWFRFPILLNSEEEKNKLIKLWRKNKIIFWNQWSWSNIIPIWIDLEKAQYKIWSCPVAEDISKRILILPNHKKINKKDMDRVIKVLNTL